MLAHILRIKEDQVQAEANKYKVAELKTDNLYVHVAELEQPIEEQLQTNMAHSRLLQGLQQKGELMDTKIKNGTFKGYD